MKVRARDLLVLIDSSGEPMKALESLTFVPSLRIRHVPTAPEPDAAGEEPLLYLLGSTDTPRGVEGTVRWLDELHAAGGAPVAFLLPRAGHDWCLAATHPQFCGLVPWGDGIPIEAMERALGGARQALACRSGWGMLRHARLAWSFRTREAADPEQAWLLLESALAKLIGSSTGLSCLGMAFAEALTNAVEHGNLELDSTIKDASDDGLFRFFELREQRLADPRYGRRRVRVLADLRGHRIRVRIRNEGRGFDPRTISRRDLGSADGTFPHGMGLSMIEKLVDSFTISHDGRTICLIHRIPRGKVKAQGILPALVQDETSRRRAA